MRRWGAINPTGQQEALPLLQRHISEQLGEDWVSFNGQGHCPSVLAKFICGNAGIYSGIFRLVDGGQQTEKCLYILMMFKLPQICCLAYLCTGYYELSRGQDCGLLSAFTEGVTVFLPVQTGLRNTICHTYQLHPTVFHRCYLLLSTANGRWHCKITFSCYF